MSFLGSIPIQSESNMAESSYAASFNIPKDFIAALLLHFPLLHLDWYLEK